MKTLISFLFLILPLYSFSQIEKVNKFVVLGVSPISYKGDLSQGYQKWTSAFHIGIKKNIKKKLNGQINLMIGKVVGQNPNYSFASSYGTPDQFFTTSIASLNYDLQFNLIKKKNFILYISQGIGLMRFNVKDENNNNLTDQFNTRAKNEIYNNITFFFPQALGFMYFLPNSYGAGLQIGRLTPATDYLDNISKLSSYSKPDNLLMIKFSFLAPIISKNDKK